MALITYFTGVSGLVLVAVMLQLMVRGIEAETLVFSGLLGLRTPATKRSQAAWDAGHRAALPGMRVLVVVTVAAAVLPLPFTFGLGYRTERAFTATEVVLAVVLAVGYAAVIVLLLVIGLTADRAARALPADQVTAPRA